MEKKNNLEDFSEDEEIDREEDEDLEELDKILLKTQENFRSGNESVNKYDSSPGEILNEYQDFN